MKKFDYFATGAVALVIIPLSLWAGFRGWSPYKLWGITLNLNLAVFSVAMGYLILESIRIKSMPFMTLLGCLAGLLISVPTHVFYPGRHHSVWDTTSLIIFTITYGILGLVISIIPAVKKSRRVAFEKLKSIGDPHSIDVLKIALKHEDSSIRNAAIRRLKKIGSFEALEIVKLHKMFELAKIEKAEYEKEQKRKQKEELLRIGQRVYSCSKCGQRVGSGTTQCPKCRTMLGGVRCRSCGFTGSSTLYAFGRCPKCNGIM